jgi:hypothetical protein
MSKTMWKVLAGLAALAALALGGSAIAGAAGSASTTTTSTSTDSGAAGRPPAPARPPFNSPAHGTSAHESAEKAVTGEAAAKAQAAAVKSLGGGTAGGVTTDYGGKGYEVTVTRSDGTKTEVHLDSSFNLMRGPGGPAGRGGMPPSGSPPSGSPPAGAPPAA